MSFDEKNTWAYGIIALLAYGVYLWLVLSQTVTVPLPETSYVIPLLATVGGAIVAAIIASIVLSIGAPKGRAKSDQRDRDIHRFGEAVGSSIVVIGALIALILAMLQLDHFWIANVIYLSFVVSALFTVMARLAGYHEGIPTW